MVSSYGLEDWTLGMRLWGGLKFICSHTSRPALGPTQCSLVFPKQGPGELHTRGRAMNN
jgi:hypothetical protein